MGPPPRKTTSDVRTAGGAHTLGVNRIASSSVVAGSPNWSDRQVRISQVAYYKAQQREFAPGHDWEDWFAAEREVAELDGAGTLGE
jgi:hypothetical protein